MSDERPDPIEDLETLDQALGALKEDGLDADAEKLEAAGDILGGLETTAAEDAETAGTEAHQEISAGIDALDSITAGDGDESDVEKASEVINAVGVSLQQALIEAVMGEVA